MAGIAAFLLDRIWFGIFRKGFMKCNGVYPINIAEFDSDRHCSFAFFVSMAEAVAAAYLFEYSQRSFPVAFMLITAALCFVCIQKFQAVVLEGFSIEGYILNSCSTGIRWTTALVCYMLSMELLHEPRFVKVVSVLQGRPAP
eukprot:GHVU01074810.1.p1 GENE.GHVU01074810.1~~GHVU01074810.1.p1  ORF type:complete len:142 (+),score=26.58 GHVU01074810.1:1-426(+)